MALDLPHPGRPRSRPGQLKTLALAVAVYGVLTFLAYSTATRLPPPSFVAGTSAVGLFGLAVWMFASERVTWTLAVLALYLGLLDGFLKLSTGSHLATLGRDVLLYSIVAGIVARAVIRRRSVSWPPFTALALVYVGFVAVEVFNPGSGDLGRAVAAMRPHLEFVPLFVLAFLTVTTKERLKVLLLMLALIGAVNGVVSLIQFNLSPEQLASWGPGYEEKVKGTGDVSARTFKDASGVTRTRPFGLAADSGGGGLVALLTLPAALALVSMWDLKRNLLIGLPVLLGIALAVITSQGRAVMVGAFAAVLAYALLAVTSRRLAPTIAGILLAGLVTYGATTVLGNDPANQGAFDRYKTIAPSSFLETAQQDRGSSLTLVDDYIWQYPLGAGIGSVGPASGFGRAAKDLNGETEFNFLLAELGIAGALVFLTFHLRVVFLAFQRVRRVLDSELRAMLAAIAAPLIALLVIYTSGAPSAGSPAGPFIWGGAGILVYWLMTYRAGFGRPPVLQTRPQGGVAAAPTPASSPSPAASPNSRSVAIVHRAYVGRVDAIHDYSRRLVPALDELGHEARLVVAEGQSAWAVRDADLATLRSGRDLVALLADMDVVVVQYNPFSYGRWGYAPWLPKALAAVRRGPGRPVLGVMVHEAHVPIAADKRLPMAVWQRLQLRALLRQTDVAFAATESLGELLRRLKGVENVVHLPVGSNLPDMRSERDHRRRAMAVPSDALVIAIFGTGHAARLIGHIVEAVNFAASTQRATVLLNLGAGAPELYGVAPSVRVIAPGRQPGREVACHLAAADLFLAPLSDGVSTRRTTVMAALQHELCVIGTSGPNTDRLLLDAPDAVRLVPAANRAAFADAVREVAQDPEAQRAQAAAGKALHDEHFTWAAIGGRMLEALEARR